MNNNNLKNFSIGYDSRRNISGRPKKYITTLKAQGYSNSEICDTIRAILSFTESEIDDIIENNTSTMLELMICKALKKGYENGSLYALETILTRALGRPSPMMPNTQLPIQQIKVLEITPNGFIENM